MTPPHTDNPALEPNSTTDSPASSCDTQAVAHAHRQRAASEPPSVPPPEIGTEVGSYVLLQKLGEGASCHVFRGCDKGSGTPVALKILNWANVYDRTAALKQLRMEAMALARVKHSLVVRFIDFGFDPRWPYLATEYCEGRTLGELLRAGGALTPRWSLSLAMQIAEALGAVWQAGLVHRDIKPDNVLVGPKGTTKLIDFGLARSESLEATRDQTGPEVAGTAAYLAPEQAKDASMVDHRADIYALGVTLYEMLTGRLPFEGRNRVQVIFQHLNTQPVPPIQRTEGIPQLLSDLCLWMLSKNPDDRPQNYQELRQAFNTVLGMAS